MPNPPSPLAAGVSPDGFQNVHEVRILICDLLDTLQEPVSKSDLASLFQENNLVNFFTLSTALAQLLQEGQLSAVPELEETYQLNPLGREAAHFLAHTLPRSVREHLAQSAKQLLARRKLERENEVAIKEVLNGYQVQVVMHDTDMDLLRLDLFVPDKAQAEAVQEKVLQDPAAFYTQIIDFLTK